ncbi:helix-turn-helix domain-containing protein [Halegenticoccus tardaugens]|uniref:helix-turn-helix domain-containing protein n=1 Tax=Halegenticoccus tardaugens TaxID=2071624 RepID=UPI00100B08CE|nr:helix-turn-helix domain-containing protein [Halegenticoccus tardaugens]
MSKLADVDADAIREALGAASEAKPAKRLMVALAYKDGVAVSTLSKRYGIPRSTVYYWLDRFENESIEDAIEDEKRPGRPRKLSAVEQEVIRGDLGKPPAEHGYDAAEWTPVLLREHIERRTGVSYSLGHTRRLLSELSASE